MYLPRAVGTGLGFFCVAIGIWPLDPAWWLWALLFAHAFVWPHLAFQLARKARQPLAVEQRNLLFDGFAGGCWAGVMGLNPLPTVIILSMIAMDKIAAGGWPMLFKTLLMQALGIAVGLGLFAPPLFPPTSYAQMLGCLPILLVYPMAIGMICYRVTEQLAEHKRTLARLSQTDSLTGLINHGAWKELLLREFTRCRGGARQNSMALIDIDHFKQINDTYGHLVGDAILRTVSTTLSTHLRKTDLVGRYGGDEFCVILPDTTAAQAQEILERLRRAVDDFEYPGLPQLSLSLSIGIASYGPHLAAPDMWLHEADMALYDAKSAGRNTVTVANATPERGLARPL
jgi:diguanylate cyclase